MEVHPLLLRHTVRSSFRLFLCQFTFTRQGLWLCSRKSPDPVNPIPSLDLLANLALVLGQS